MTDERYPFRAGLWECPNGHQEVASLVLRGRTGDKCARCELSLTRLRVVTLYGRRPSRDKRQEARRQRQNRMAIRRERLL